MKRWIIWSNSERHTGVVTDDHREAALCVLGQQFSGMNTHLHDFIDTYGDDGDEFVLEEIEIEDDEAPSPELSGRV